MTSTNTIARKEVAGDDKVHNCSSDPDIHQCKLVLVVGVLVLPCVADFRVVLLRIPAR